MISAVVAGLSGRMGKEIASVATDCGIKIVGGIGRQQSLTEWLKSNAKPQVLIDFSLPDATIAIAETCAANSLPLVSGVTGLGQAELRALEAAGKKIPVLYSANMSIGVQMLAKALDALKGAEDFDLVIEDIHHRHKKDAPSGTAKLLDDELKKRTGRAAGEIVSLRGGGVVGVHRVLALSESESLTFEHTALNRAVFARGACRAARWVIGRAPGFYSLRDTL